MIVLSGAELVLPDRILSPGTLVVDAGRIVEIKSGVGPSAGASAFAFHEHYIVPGFIDVHVHSEIELLGSTGSERIETLVQDLLRHSEEAADIVQGEEVGAAMLRLREFMFEHVYLGPAAQRERPRIERMLRALFAHYADEFDDEQRVVDWLAGMTDRFAIREFENLSVPQGF